MNIPMEDIKEGIEGHNGYCIVCKDITNFGGVEPDAENYLCEDCGCKSVMGIEQAILMGEIL